MDINFIIYTCDFLLCHVETSWSLRIAEITFVAVTVFPLSYM